ncbi:DNA excision repair protein ERCC-6-like protein [Oxytricha trifallax]|uniref:DNA excision repair protein ERCC-6-like protein n=1 Tax=Oxytricha trifallax TaxID=1172189 RepID=A0A073IAM9_9SPIT|nr:DNA excision repair protein ERCC-6-like protein [Oxytricha trifallax]
MLILNSQVGGLGLNLIAADRAVILDPDWNPQVDNQCIDRLYRIGQKKDVIVFRFITVGTVEEHMYRRQIYKSSMTNLAIEKECDDVQRIFDQESLEKLLNFDPNSNKCETLELLEQRNDKKNNTIETPSNQHTKNFLLNHELIEGISDHLEIFQTADN